MYNRLIKYLDKHNIIFSWQFGFRVNHSTEHQDAKKVSFTACHSGRAFRPGIQASCSYSLSQNCWDTFVSPCPFSVGIQGLVTEP